MKLKRDSLDFYNWASIIKKGHFSNYKLEARIEQALRNAYMYGVEDGKTIIKKSIEQ